MTKNHVLLADFKWPCVGNHAFCINGNWNEGKPGDACDVTMTKGERIVRSRYNKTRRAQQANSEHYCQQKNIEPVPLRRCIRYKHTAQRYKQNILILYFAPTAQYVLPNDNHGRRNKYSHLNIRSFYTNRNR